MLSKAFEDYLKIIYKLSDKNISPENKGVSTSDIADRLSISQASVSNMLKKLAEHDLISYEPYYGVELLPKGRKIALNIIRKHRVLEQFLVEKLGYSWDEVDVEAEVLEHAISNKFTDRMWESLGRPLRDPHGSPIPDENGEIISDDVVPLVEFPEKTIAQIIRIQNRTPEELRYFSSIGMIKDAQVLIHSKSPFNGPLSIEINKQFFALDYKLSRSILVC
jgi:DtxR family Mn-dependent transcriptional regulator